MEPLIRMTLPNSPTYSTAAASYASFHRGRLFVGDFENDRVYRYDTTSKGVLIKKTRVAYPTPTLVQGLAVTDKQFVFSRSYGRTRYSYLTVVDRTTWSQRHSAMPNMSQGITWAPSSATNAFIDITSGADTHRQPTRDSAAVTAVTRPSAPVTSTNVMSSDHATTCSRCSTVTLAVTMDALGCSRPWS